jgi:hypothetical protein
MPDGADVGWRGVKPLITLGNGDQHGRSGHALNLLLLAVDSIS